MENEIIVEIGGEGGGITLYGLRKGKGWLYSRHVIDHTLAMLDEPWIEHDSPLVSTWSAALRLLDVYPWPHLYPLRVHPDFRAKVLKAVVARNKRTGNDRGLDRWQRACGVPVEG